MPLTHGISRSTWRILAVIYASMFALSLANILWTGHVADQNNRKWCGVLRTFHDAYSSNPPSTDAGRDIRAQIEELYADFDCASVPRPKP